MAQHNVAIFVILMLVAMVLVTFWRKVLLLLLSLVVAVFLFGVVYLVQLVHT